jgi:acyl carrier protein
MHLSTEEIISKVNQTILEHIGCDPDKITRESDFLDDLGCDSLDMVELTMAFEEQFGIEIPDHEADKVAKVGDAYDMLSAKLS